MLPAIVSVQPNQLFKELILLPSFVGSLRAPADPQTTPEHNTSTGTSTHTGAIMSNPAMALGNLAKYATGTAKDEDSCPTASVLVEETEEGLEGDIVDSNGVAHTRWPWRKKVSSTLWWTASRPALLLVARLAGNCPSRTIEPLPNPPIQPSPPFPLSPAFDQVPLDRIQSFFHMPQLDAAAELGVSVSRLKRECSFYKLKRWPSRKVRIRPLVSPDSLLTLPHLPADQSRAGQAGAPSKFTGPHGFGQHPSPDR